MGSTASEDSRRAGLDRATYGSTWRTPSGLTCQCRQAHLLCFRRPTHARPCSSPPPPSRCSLMLPSSSPCLLCVRFSWIRGPFVRPVLPPLHRPPCWSDQVCTSGAAFLPCCGRLVPCPLLMRMSASSRGWT